MPGFEAEDVPLEIPVGPGLRGDLRAPQDPLGIVLFAHGSGSSRLSPRNRFVAEALNRAGLATVLLDLLTASEEADRANVFDVDLLADRLVETARWLGELPGARGLAPAFFGASTGAAAALVASARLGGGVRAVVSRGGRPDLAGSWLPLVASPTLLVVGGKDRHVLELNRDALARLTCPSELVVVPGAGHLFEEPGTLEEVARLACDWFGTQLREGPAAR